MNGDLTVLRKGGWPSHPIYPAEAHGITHSVRYTPEDFGPWWWLPTARAMAGMAEAAGFEVVDQSPTWGGNAHTLLLRPVGS